MSRYTQQDQYTVGGLNAENESIEQAIADTLSRKGDTPNAMETDLDMNAKRILNLPDPINSSEPMTLSFGEGIVDQAEAEVTKASIQADRAEEAKYGAETAEKGAVVARDGAETYAQQADSYAEQLSNVLDNYVSSNLTFPLDLGFVSDATTGSVYNLGGLQ